MPENDNAWVERQRARWMRPNAHLFIRADAYRFMPPGAPRWYGKDAVRYFWPEPQNEWHAEQRRGHDASQDLDEAEAERARFRHELAKLRLDWELLKLRCGLEARKYSPNQPRVPAGNADGGQWTAAIDKTYHPLESFAAARGRGRSTAYCMAQYAVDGLLCNSVASSKKRACWAQAAERLSACLGGRPIPPLNH